MLLLNCSVCGKGKSTFVKNQELNNFDDTVKSQIKTHSDIRPPKYRSTLVLMQNLSRF